MFGEGTLSALEAEHAVKAPEPDRLRVFADQEVVLIEQALGLLLEQAEFNTSDYVAVDAAYRLRAEFSHEDTQRFHAARRKMVVA